MGKKHIKLTDENKSWGLTALIVICLSILFYLIMTRIPALKVGVQKLISVTLPIILGVVMAYLLLPVYNGLNDRLRALFARKMKEKTARSLASGLSVVLSILLLLAVVFGFAVIVIPQILKSVITISMLIPTKWDSLMEKVNELLKNNPQLMRYASQVLENAEKSLNGILADKILPNFSNALTTVTSKIINVAGFLFDLIVGMIVCVYMLLGKERFSAQAKKIVYSRMSTQAANKLVSDTRRVHWIFAGYISGSLLDSLIVGLLCGIILPFLNMPYVLLISVIVGVTNIIPFFGPFIGAVPSILLVLMEGSLKKAIILAVFITILQQIDGNVIKPRALGNSTGLPSFWVLFSILVGGGLFGFAGLLFAVPVFATIYMFVSRNVERNLRKRRLPYETDDFLGVPALDPKTHMPVYDEALKNDERTGGVKAQSSDVKIFFDDDDGESDGGGKFGVSGDVGRTGSNGSGGDANGGESDGDGERAGDVGRTGCNDVGDANGGESDDGDGSGDENNDVTQVGGVGGYAAARKENVGRGNSAGRQAADSDEDEERSLNDKIKKYAVILAKSAYEKVKEAVAERKNSKTENAEVGSIEVGSTETKSTETESSEVKRTGIESGAEKEKGKAENGAVEKAKVKRAGTENGAANEQGTPENGAVGKVEEKNKNTKNNQE